MGCSTGDYISKGGKLLGRIMQGTGAWTDAHVCGRIRCEVTIY